MYKFNREDKKHIAIETHLGADPDMIPDRDVDGVIEDYTYLHKGALRDYEYWKAKVSKLQTAVRELKGVLTIIWKMKSLRGEKELLLAKLYCERDLLNKSNEQLFYARRAMKYYDSTLNKLRARKMREKMKNVGEYHYKFVILNSHGNVIDSLEFNCERDLTKEEAIEILGKAKGDERYGFFYTFFTTFSQAKFGDFQKSKSKPGDEKFPTFF